jgi:hypothetical protein
MTAWRVPASICLVALFSVLAGPGRAAADDRRFYPADTEIIVSVNIRQMLESELVKGNKEGLDLLKAMVGGALQHNQEAQTYLREMGFDVFRDLDRITTVGGASADPNKVLVIVTGRFDAKKLSAAAEKAARDHGDVLKLSREGKHQVIEITPPGGEQHTVFVALTGGKTLLISPTRPLLTGALAQAAEEKEAHLKKEVADLLASQPKNPSVGFVATGAALGKLLAASKNPQVAQAAPIAEKILQKIDGFNSSITLASDVQFQLGVGTKDAETAKQFQQQAAFGLVLLPGLLAKEVEKNPQLAPLLDVVKTLRPTAQGNTFIIRGRVPPETLAKLLKGALNR